MGYISTYTYDALGNLTGVVQNGSRNRTFAYDGLSRLTSETTPEAGNITYGYDASGHAGDLTSRVAPAPNQTGSATVTTTYAYDLLHRLTQKSYNDGATPTAHFVYDTPVTWSNPTATTANVVGRLSEAYVDTCPANGGNEIFGYDAMGRVALNSQTTPSNCGSGNWQLLYTYDLAGDMTTYTNGIGKTFTQAFDTAGRATQLTSSYVDANHPATLATVDSSLGFYPTGALRKITYGNGLTGTTAIEGRLQPCRINLNSGGSAITDGCADGAVSGTVQDFFYAYGTSGSTNNGNVTIMNAGGLQNFNRTFGFDSLNRLATMSDAHTSNSCLGLQWAYDAWGNRTAQSVTAGTCGTFSATVNASNQLSGSPYAYDVAGNLTADGSHTYFYDAENRLTQVDGTLGSCSTATACYVYDALGRRVQKTVPNLNPMNFLYDLRGNVVAEVAIAPGTWNSSNPSIGWHAGYIYGGNSLLAEYTNSTTYFVHADHLGSTRLVTDINKNVVQNLDYLPFGEINSTDSGISSHKFTGDERDSETALDHTWFRQYSSQFARWMTPDPAGLAAVDPSNPQSWNRYSYALNDPVDFVDPSGTCTVDPDLQIFSCPPDNNGGSLTGQCFDILLDGVFIGNSCDQGAGPHGPRLDGRRRKPPTMSGVPMNCSLSARIFNSTTFNFKEGLDVEAGIFNVGLSRNINFETNATTMEAELGLFGSGFNAQRVTDTGYLNPDSVNPNTEFSGHLGPIEHVFGGETQLSTSKLIKLGFALGGGLDFSFDLNKFKELTASCKKQ